MDIDDDRSASKLNRSKSHTSMSDADNEDLKSEN